MSGILSTIRRSALSSHGMERDGVRLRRRVLNGRPILRWAFYKRGTIEVARDLLRQRFWYTAKTSGVIVSKFRKLAWAKMILHVALGCWHCRQNWTRVIFGPPGYAQALAFSNGKYARVSEYRRGAGWGSGMRLPDPRWNQLRALTINVLQEARGSDGSRSYVGSRQTYARRWRLRAFTMALIMTWGDLVVRAPDREGSGQGSKVTPRIGITKCAELPLRFLMRKRKPISSVGN